MIRNISCRWEGATWREAIADYHRRTYIALDPDKAESVTALQAAGYEEFTPLEKSLADQQTEAWESIKRERERRRTGGVTVLGKWFHTDDPSRIQHLGLTMMGANIPAGLMWKTMDGSFVAMTQQLVGQIFIAVAGSDQHNFANAETHRIAMEALPTPEGYDYSTGWLPIYGE